jgi:hypothetical protein
VGKIVPLDGRLVVKVRKSRSVFFLLDKIVNHLGRVLKNIQVNNLVLFADLAAHHQILLKQVKILRNRGIASDWLQHRDPFVF